MNLRRVIAVSVSVARVALALLAAERVALAQTVAVSGNPPLLRISTAIAGSGPTSVSDATTTYTVHNSSHAAKQIVAALNADMPVGVTLTVTLAAPSGATSNGPVALSATNQPVVINIPSPTNTTKSITYQFSATVAAGVIPNQTRIVTFTIINYP